MIFWINFKERKYSDKPFSAAESFVNITEDSYIVWNWCKDNKAYVVPCANFMREIENYAKMLLWLDVCPFDEFNTYDYWVRNMLDKGLKVKFLTEDLYLKELCKVIVKNITVSLLTVTE